MARGLLCPHKETWKWSAQPGNGLVSRIPQRPAVSSSLHRLDPPRHISPEGGRGCGVTCCCRGQGAPSRRPLVGRASLPGRATHARCRICQLLSLWTYCLSFSGSSVSSDNARVLGPALSALHSPHWRPFCHFQATKHLPFQSFIFPENMSHHFFWCS